jgi:hypothetical protein
MESPEKAEEMGIYASSEMDFSQVHKYTESDNNMMWFIADRP